MNGRILTSFWSNNGHFLLKGKLYVFYASTNEIVNYLSIQIQTFRFKDLKGYFEKDKKLWLILKWTVENPYFLS